MQERRQFSGGVKYILPEFQQQGTALLPGAAVLTPTSLILSSTTPCELWLDSSTIFLLRSTIFLYSRASNLLSFVQGCHTVSSTPCHGAWTSAPLSSYPFTRWERTASISQIEIPICARRTTTHQFIWWQQHTCGALGGLPMECGLVGEHYETPNFDSEVDAHPPGMALPRTALVRLKRLRIGVGRFRSCLHKWGMVPSTLVSVTRAEQAVANVCMLAKVCFAIFLHVVLHCLIH